MDGGLAATIVKVNVVARRGDSMMILWTFLLCYSGFVLFTSNLISL